MDAFVQFVRNAMCCIKDLNLLSDTVLYDASLVQRLFPSLPSPLNETTPLEVAISISQFYAFWSVTRSGYSLIAESLSKIRYLRQQQQPPPSSKSPSASTIPAHVAADRLVREALAQSQTLAWRNLVIGWNVFPIGIAFFWLFANSWHVTSTNWIGGLQGVIHALTVMEICLVPLLYYMLANAQEWLLKASLFPKLAVLVQAGNLTSDDMTLEAYQGMTKWAPYWEEKGAATNTTTNDSEKLFQKEVDQVKKTLETLIKNPTSATNGNAKATDAAPAKGEKEEKISQTARAEAAQQLQSKAKTLTLEGYREYLYFVINLVAFYGYLLGVICYYTTEHDDEVWYVRNLKLGMSHANADWHGNFAGDLMWTIEPLIILGSPSLIRNLTEPPAAAREIKVKSE